MKNKIIFLKIIVFMVVFLSTSNLSAQELEWVQSAGGLDFDGALDVVHDKYGNVIITGVYYANAIFGDGQTSITNNGERGIFVAKYNSDGSLLWVKSANGVDECAGWNVSVDNAANIYITGFFEDKIVLGAGQPDSIAISTTSGQDSDMFLAKYRPDGKIIWVQQTSGEDDAGGNCVRIDNNGNVFVSGSFKGTEIFGQSQPGEITLTATGDQRDIFIAKYDSLGLLHWVKKAGGPESDYAIGLYIDLSNSLLLTGYFKDSAIFGQGEQNETTLVSESSSDIVIAKYSNDGDLIWAKHAGGPAQDGGYSITSDKNNDIYITGFYDSTITFASGLDNMVTLSYGDQENLFIAKYSDDGSFLWAKEVVSETEEMGACIEADINDDIIVSGFFTNTVTFGVGELNETSLTSFGRGDIFIAKYDNDGLLQWVQSAGGPGNDNCRGLSVESSGSIIITGYFDSTSTFGSGLPNEKTISNVDEEDIFIAKYSYDITDIREQVAINSLFNLYQNYPNPFNPKTTIEYSIPQKMMVEISVYNLLGQKIETLLEENQDPGHYQINWDGTEHTSGIYYYKIKTNNYFQTKKMLLLK
ncbi:MAG: T9SS type A sorting domain-containing protein [Calditrichales bacterium]|nr:T9SS type A sorting domain-containing protein [Calditrichales bacterium]